MSSLYYTFEDTHCVCLVLPGLFATEAVGPIVAETPYLCRCLSHCSNVYSNSGTFESVILNWFNGQSRVLENSAGLLGYQLDGYDLQADEMVLRVDPVFQQMDINHAVLADQSVLDLDQTEASAIIETINQHFVSDGLQFTAGGPMRWYCKFRANLDLSTRPLSHAIGRDVARESPTGPDAAVWRRWLAEIEMLLYSHPVNQKRQKRGEALVNSLWLWGEGNLPSNSVPVTGNAAVFGDHFYTRSVAHHYQVPMQNIEQFPSLAADSSVLVVDDQLQSAATTANESLRIERLNQLEQMVFKPLWTNLKSARWKSARIWVGGDRWLQLDAKTRWQFWRRQKLLSEYLVHPESLNDNA